MHERELVSSILSSLKRVLTGQSPYIELQRLVEEAVADDKVAVLSRPTLAHVFELQKELELVAVHQAASTDRGSSYSHQQIAERLAKYVEPLTKAAT